MSRDRTVNRYPEGYIPKIKYWISKMDEEVGKQTPSITQLEAIQEKLRYFIGKQKELDPEYQPIQ
jgi:hypothetical protein